MKGEAEEDVVESAMHMIDEGMWMELLSGASVWVFRHQRSVGGFVFRFVYRRKCGTRWGAPTLAIASRMQQTGV